MSFGSPTSDPIHAAYAAVVTHSNGQVIEIRSVLDPGSNVLDPTDMDEAWTAAIALLDGDADFTYEGGQKTYTTYESYTL